MRTIQEKWEAFRAGVLVDDLDPEDLETCKFAFYSGAYTPFCIVHEMASANVRDDVAQMIHDNLIGECRTYLETMLAKVRAEKGEQESDA